MYYYYIYIFILHYKVLLLENDEWRYTHDDIMLEEYDFPSEWEGYYHPEDLILKEKG